MRTKRHEYAPFRTPHQAWSFATLAQATPRGACHQVSAQNRALRTPCDEITTVLNATSVSPHEYVPIPTAPPLPSLPSLPRRPPLPSLPRRQTSPFTFGGPNRRFAPPNPQLDDGEPQIRRLHLWGRPGPVSAPKGETRRWRAAERPARRRGFRGWLTAPVERLRITDLT
jgi:hypothetical protein